LPEGCAVTRDRARKKSVRARMAASGEPYSVAARKLGRTGAAGEEARDEVITRVEATFRRLAGAVARAAWDHAVPEQARTRLRTASSGIATGIIEPANRRFVYTRVKEDTSGPGLVMAFGPLDLDPAPNAYGACGEDPLELLMRLRSVTSARYEGEETIRGARCRKAAVTVSDTTAVLTVWADDEHVRQIQAVLPKRAERLVVTLVATTTVTAQLWDFGVPVDSINWALLPPPGRPRGVLGQANGSRSTSAPRPDR
jgi:hypothetical protein